jgi:hypothetical protein
MSGHAIRIEDLDSRRSAVLDGIEKRGEVWQIETDNSHFVLGPESLLSSVLGLYDEAEVST